MIKIIRKLTERELENKERDREIAFDVAKRNGLNVLGKSRTAEENIALLKESGVKLTKEQIQEEKQREVWEKLGYKIFGTTYCQEQLAKLFDIPYYEDIFCVDNGFISER